MFQKNYPIIGIREEMSSFKKLLEVFTNGCLPRRGGKGVTKCSESFEA